MKAQLKLVLYLTMVLILSSLGAIQTSVSQSPTDPPPPELTLGEANDGERVELAASEVLALRLESNPSTGYVWQVRSLDKDVLIQVGSEFEPPAQGVKAIGAPGTQVLRFLGVSEGTTALDLVYLRPWQRDALKSYSVEVHSEGAYEGSYPDSPAEPAPQLSDISSAGQPGTYDYCAEIGGCTRIKDQGNCGSCWAFAGTGVFEQLIKGVDGNVRNLSEQYLVSTCCDSGDCGGGWVPFEYFVDRSGANGTEPGAVYEEDCPYQASNTSCGGPYPSHERADDYGQVGDSVSQLKDAIIEYGPLWVGVCADNAFSSYNGGIFDSTTCTSLNHAVILYGWDDSQGNNGIWFMRNSWGEDWGEDGNMRIGYGVNGIGDSPYALLYEDSGPTPTPPPPTKTPTPTPPPVTPTPTPEPDCKTYTSGDVPKELPVGASSVSSFLEIGPDGLGDNIVDVDVNVDMEHSYVGDLIFTLEYEGSGPTGSRATIIDRPGYPNWEWGCRGDDIAATLDDEAGSAVEDECAAGSPTIDGVFKPNEALNIFDGGDKIGRWVLTVEDAYVGEDGGTLKGWSLRICTSPAPPPPTPTPEPPTPTPEPPTPTPAPGMHVGDLDGVGYPVMMDIWYAEVTIMVHDGNHNPLSDATVSGEFSGEIWSWECTTDSSGQCTIESDWIWSESSVTFTVRDVYHPDYPYEPDNNHDPDGDSDGTVITVQAP